MAQAFAELSSSQIQAGLTAKEFSARKLQKTPWHVSYLPTRRYMLSSKPLKKRPWPPAARVDAAIAAGDIAQAGPLAGVPVAF